MTDAEQITQANAFLARDIHSLNELAG